MKSFVLLVYLLLGICMSAVIRDAPISRFGFIEWLFLAFVHVPFVAFGVAFARSSTPTNGGYSQGLSPSGWGTAIVASYFVGFIGFLILKRYG